MANIIRTANIDDLCVLTRLYLAYSEELQKCGLQYEINLEAVPEVLSTRIRSRLFFVGLALSDEKAEGFIICSLVKIGREYLCEGSGQVGYVNDIYISPSMRRTGYAAALLDAAKAWLKECGVNSLELEVLHGNIGGKSFWERTGGREIATFYQIRF